MADETPVTPNPSTGGSPAEPSEPAPPDTEDVPPAPQAAAAAEASSAPSSSGTADADDAAVESLGTQLATSATVTVAATPTTREERIAAETEACKSMKVGELKKELQGLGVSTEHFFEKSEFVGALAEARADGVNETATGAAGGGAGAGAGAVEDGGGTAPAPAFNFSVGSAAATAAQGGGGGGNNAHAFNFNLGAAAQGLAGLDDDDDDDEEEDGPANMMQMLPPCVVRRVEKLRSLNEERDAIMEEYQAERAALERKFAARCRPLYDKRVDVVGGTMDDEIDAEADDDDDNDNDGESETIVGIPQFWVCAMGHMEAIAELITERDVDCLEHLRDVTCTDDDDGKGFTLSFHFNPDTNPYFTDTVLTKTYDIPNLLLDDEPILKNVTGCDIDWKPDMCLTYREVKKKQRNKSGKRAGQIRTIIKKERAESFFHFFCPPKIPTMDEMDEEEADAIEHAFDVDYDVAQAFRSHIIPRAVLWFTGEAMDEGMMDVEELEDEWPGGEGGGGDGDGDDDAPPPPPPPPLPDGGNNAAAAASPFPPPAEGAENPECKQN